MSQAVNFFIVLLVLRLFVYKPVLKVLHERKTKIEEGITKAVEAERRLNEAEEIKKEKIHQAEEEVLMMFKESDEKLKEAEKERLEMTNKKIQQAMKNAELIIQQKRNELDESLDKEIKVMLRLALEKIASIKPEMLDNTLLDQAIREMKSLKSKK